MIFKSVQTGLIATGFLITSFGLVQAQPALEGSEAADSQEEPQPPSQASMLEEARLLLDRMEASADSIDRMLRQARENNDVVRILCLDDKLSQMNVASRSAADRVASIELAGKSGNAERMEHDQAVLEALSNRGAELMSEANQCIGAEEGQVGGTELQITVDPDIPEADTASPAPPTIISTPPVAASPTH